MQGDSVHVHTWRGERGPTAGKICFWMRFEPSGEYVLAGSAADEAGVWELVYRWAVQHGYGWSATDLPPTEGSRN